MRRFQRKRSGSASVLLGVRGKLYARIALIALGVIALIALLLVILSPSSPALDSPEIAVIQRRGVLFVGVRSDMPGFSKNGEGLEIEIGKRIAAKIFPEKGENGVQFVEMNSRMLSAKISDASIDAGICLSEKDANTSRYIYSNAYYKDNCIIAVKKGTTPNLSQAVIGYITNSTLVNRMDKFAEKKGFKYTKREYASYEMMLNDLERGDITGALITGAYMKVYSSQYPISAYPENIGTIEYAVVCGSDMSPLIQIANDVLADMKKSGELQRLIDQYIGG